MSHFDQMKSAFGTSHTFMVVGAGDMARLMMREDTSIELDLSKHVVQHYERNPRCVQFLMRNGLEVYFYTYHDVLVVMG